MWGSKGYTRIHQDNEGEVVNKSSIVQRLRNTIYRRDFRPERTERSCGREKTKKRPLMNNFRQQSQSSVATVKREIDSLSLSRLCPFTCHSDDVIIFQCFRKLKSRGWCLFSESNLFFFCSSSFFLFLHMYLYLF